MPAANPGSHDYTVAINILLAAAPGTPFSFGVPTLFVDEAQGTGNPLNGGARFQVFTSYPEAQTAQAAAEITAEVLAAALVHFTNNPSNSWQVVRVDTAGAETYPDAHAAALALGLPMWGICIDTRSAAIQVAMAAVTNVARHMLVYQSAEAGWLVTSGGIPAALAGINVGRDKGVYHDTAAAWADVGYLSKWLAANPDIISSPTELAVDGVAALATRLTGAQMLAAKDNGINVMASFGDEQSWIAPGENADGIASYELLTRDWLDKRMFEAISQYKATMANRYLKVLLNDTGAAGLLSVCNAVLATAIQAQHLDPDPEQTFLRVGAINTVTRDLTLDGQGLIAGSAKTIGLNLYLDR